MFPAWPRRTLLSLTAGALLLASGAPALAAAPLAGQHYPNGATDFLGGILPPQPGFYLINYLLLLQKDRLMDDDGNKVPLPFHADVTAEVPRFIWVSPYKLFGANYGAQLFIPTYNARVESPAVGGEQEDRGLGDIIFAPIILGWHFSPNFHMVFAEDIWAPTGGYQEDNFATQLLSKNHWTFESVLAVTYLVGGLDLSAKFMYDFNTKNNKYDADLAGPGGTVDLKPGQEFHVDYGISYGKSMDFRYGVSGYYYQQITKDKVDGNEVDEKTRFASIGPTFKYWPGMGKWQFTLKHLWEFGTKNAPEGQNTWLNATYAF